VYDSCASYLDCLVSHPVLAWKVVKGVVLSMYAPLLMAITMPCNRSFAKDKGKEMGELEHLTGSNIRPGDVCIALLVS